MKQLGIDFFPRGEAETREKIMHRKIDTTILDLEKKMALQHKQYVEIKNAVQDETKKLE